MSKVDVRPATAGDVDEVLALWSRAAENDSRPADTPDAVLRLVERDPGALLVAVADGAIVGTVIAGWDGWRAHLYRLAVAPEARRQGTGRMLLDHAADRLAGLGATRLDAMVLDANELGASIWTVAGYGRQPDWSRWVKPVD